MLTGGFSNRVHLRRRLGVAAAFLEGRSETTVCRINRFRCTRMIEFPEFKQ